MSSAFFIDASVRSTLIIIIMNCDPKTTVAESYVPMQQQKW